MRTVAALRATDVPRGGPAGASAPPRLLLAARHEATLEGLRANLQERGLAAVADARDARSAVREAARAAPDVCIVELDLPGGGIAACAAIAARPGAPPVVVLAASEDASDFFAAVRAGASGYLLDSLDADRLAEELRAVAQGGPAIGRPFVAHLLEEFRGTRRLAASELSAREREVLALLAAGSTTKEVAARLGVEATTVRRHLSEATRKLGAPDRDTALALFERVQGRGEHG